MIPSEIHPERIKVNVSKAVRLLLQFYYDSKKILDFLIAVWFTKKGLCI